MGETALPGAAIEGPNGVRAQRPEAHGRDIEDRGRIRLAAVRPADRDTERRRRHGLGADRMAQPFVAVRIDIVLRSEGTLVERHLGALIDDGTLVATERRAVLLALQEV